MATISRTDIRLQLPILLLPALALAASGCGPRYARTAIRDGGGYTVELRAKVEDGRPVDRGFDHPATISAIRVTNILSRIDVRPEGEDDGSREPAIHSALLYDLGSLISLALAQADSTQEVVVRAVRRDRRLGIFTQRFLTSFVSYVSKDLLYFHFVELDEEVAAYADGSVPEPWPGRQTADFKVLPSEGMVPVGRHGVAVAWRKPLFRAAGRVRLGPGGELLRREILLESPEGEADLTPREADRP